MALWPRSTITHWNNILKTHYIHWNPPDCSCVALWKRCGSILCVWVQNQTCTSHWKTKTSASFTQSLWLVIFPRSAHTHTHTHTHTEARAALPTTARYLLQTLCLCRRFVGFLADSDGTLLTCHSSSEEMSESRRKSSREIIRGRRRNVMRGEERRGEVPYDRSTVGRRRKKRWSSGDKLSKGRQELQSQQSGDRCVGVRSSYVSYSQPLV